MTLCECMYSITKQRMHYEEMCYHFIHNNGNITKLELVVTINTYNKMTLCFR